MKRGAPIRPEEIPEKKRKIIPDFVFDAFNDLLIAADKKPGQTITLYQKDIKEKIDEFNEEKLEWEWHWLDIEPYYEEAGWKVVYDKPAYCESYEPIFYFTPK